MSLNQHDTLITLYSSNPILLWNFHVNTDCYSKGSFSLFSKTPSLIFYCIPMVQCPVCIYIYISKNVNTFFNFQNTVAFFRKSKWIMIPSFLVKTNRMLSSHTGDPSVIDTCTCYTGDRSVIDTCTCCQSVTIY